MVCDDSYERIMARARAEAPELIGPGWRGREPEVLEDGSMMYEMTVPAGNFLAGFGKLAESPPDSKCYRTGAGMIHVKPGCRC